MLNQSCAVLAGFLARGVDCRAMGTRKSKEKSEKSRGRKDAAESLRRDRSRPTALHVLSQTGPIVSNEDGIAGIGRIVLDTGGLAGNELVKADLAFEAGDVLRRVVGDSGNRVAVGDKMPGTRIGKRMGTRCEQGLT